MFEPLYLHQTLTNYISSQKAKNIELKLNTNFVFDAYKFQI